MAEETGLYNIAPGETPTAVASRRRIAEALLNEGMSTAPIRSGWQGMANLAKALIGGYDIGQADKQDANGVANAMKAYSSGMYGDAPPAAPPSATPTPDVPRPPGMIPSAPLAPDVAMPQGRPLKSISLDQQRPPQSAVVAALAGPGASPAILGPSAPPQQSTQSVAPAGQPAQPPAGRPDPRLVASLANPYLPKPMQELALTKAKEQMKPPEFTHFTAGDRNMVFDKSNPGNVRDLGASSENKFGNVAELRKEIHTLPSYQNWTKRVDPTYRSMVDSMHTDTKASDVNLVYGMATILDPNSVVREGEQIIIRSTASLPEWLIGSIQGLNGNARLTPDTRKNLMAEATSRAKEHYDAVVNDISPYHGIAQRFGMRPQDIIPPIRELPKIKAAPGPATPGAAPVARPAPSGVDPKIWAVMTPQERALWK